MCPQNILPVRYEWNGDDQICLQNAENYAKVNEHPFSETEIPKIPNLLNTSCNFIIVSPEMVLLVIYYKHQLQSSNQVIDRSYKVNMEFGQEDTGPGQKHSLFFREDFDTIDISNF